VPTRLQVGHGPAEGVQPVRLSLVSHPTQRQQVVPTLARPSTAREHHAATAPDSIVRGTGPPRTAAPGDEGNEGNERSRLARLPEPGRVSARSEQRPNQALAGLPRVSATGAARGRRESARLTTRSSRSPRRQCQWRGATLSTWRTHAPKRDVAKRAQAVAAGLPHRAWVLRTRWQVPVVLSAWTFCRMSLDELISRR